MTHREYPRFLYFSNGDAIRVNSAAEEAEYPPGHEDTPGKFLPPDHPGYVPRTPPPEPEPEPETVLEYENEPVEIVVEYPPDPEAPEPDPEPEPEPDPDPAPVAAKAVPKRRKYFKKE